MTGPKALEKNEQDFSKNCPKALEKNEQDYINLVKNIIQKRFENSNQMEFYWTFVFVSILFHLPLPFQNNPVFFENIPLR